MKLWIYDEKNCFGINEKNWLWLIKNIVLIDKNLKNLSPTKCPILIAEYSTYNSLNIEKHLFGDVEVISNLWVWYDSP